MPLTNLLSITVAMADDFTARPTSLTDIRTCKIVIDLCRILLY